MRCCVRPEGRDGCTGWGSGLEGTTVIYVKNDKGESKRPRWEPGEVKRVSEMVMLTTPSFGPLVGEEGVTE